MRAPPLFFLLLIAAPLVARDLVAETKPATAPALAAAGPAPSHEAGREVAPEPGRNDAAAPEVEAKGGAHGEGDGEEKEESKWGLPMWGWQFLNIGLLLSIAWFLVGKKLKAFFADRATAIKAQLEEAQSAKREAEARLKTLQAKMDALTGEVESLRAEAAKEAGRLKAQILKDAEEDAARLKQAARDEIAAAEREAKQRLQTAAAAEAAKLAAQLAQGKLTSDDHDRLIDGLAQAAREEA